MVIQWVLAHQGVSGNEEADRAVKEVTEINQVKEKWTSLTYLRKRVKEDTDHEEAATLEAKLVIKERKGRVPYLL